MALEFPSNPTLNQEFTIDATGQIYYWDGQSWTAKPETAPFAFTATSASYALSALSASTSITIGSKSPLYQVFAYINSVGTVANNTVLKLNTYNTQLNNSAGAWNTSSGDYTVSVPGLYRVDAQMTYNSHNAVSGSSYRVIATKNNVTQGETVYYPLITNAGPVCTGVLQALIDCRAAGDIISFYYQQTSGTFLYVTPGSGSGYVSIERIVTY